MTASSRRFEQGRGSIAAAVLLGGLIAALLSAVSGSAARRELFDAWQRLAPRPIAADRVAVVLIDAPSLKAVGPWPWPRYYIARLTEQIAAHGPKAIGFDMIFAEPDALDPAIFAQLYPELDPATRASVEALPSMDGVLADVMGAAPVVLARVGVPGDGIDPAALMVDPEVAGRPPRGTLSYPQALASIPRLDDVALGHAMINGPPDADGTVRRVPLTVVAGGRPLPGLAVELARIAAGAERLVWRGNTLALAGRRLPADSGGRLALHFGRFPPQSIHSAADVLAEQVPAAALAGKIVLVGLGAEGTIDIVATPLDSEEFGVVVQAQAVDAILAGAGWLSRPGWMAAAEWSAGALLTGLAAVAALGGARRRRWMMLAGLGLALALPLLSWAAFVGAGYLFDPVRPLLIGLGAILALEAALFLRSRRERARLAAELVEQQVASALQEGELQAARSIQLGMVPSGELLARLDRRVDVGAVLSPARSVGGDFYDAIRIDADRLLFVIGDVTGKGVPAALYMALSKALTKSVLTRESGSLAHTVGTLNRELMRDADEAMGVTMLVVLLDLASGAATMVNAGHENPILLRADGTIETLAMDGGPPFCVCDFPYPEERQQLVAGDTLVLITDGVTEAQNAAGGLLGTEAAREALRIADTADAHALAEALAAEVRRFEGGTEASDDLTILAVRYRGEGAQQRRTA